MIIDTLNKKRDSPILIRPLIGIDIQSDIYFCPYMMSGFEYNTLFSKNKNCQ